MSKIFQVLLGAALLSAAAYAQDTDAGRGLYTDQFHVRYAANLGAGQSVIDMTNAGSLTGVDYICANVYVFAEDQQLISCCACPVSQNDLRTLSVQKDLINNTLTPGVPTAVTIALLSTYYPGSCDAANPYGTPEVATVPGLRAWGTTLHSEPGGGYAVTETEFSQAALSDSELSKMISYCGFIQADGSGHGICNSCKQGAQGAAKQ